MIDRTQSATQAMDLTKRVSKTDNLFRSVMIREEGEENIVSKRGRRWCFKE